MKSLYLFINQMNEGPKKELIKPELIGTRSGMRYEPCVYLIRVSGYQEFNKIKTVSEKRGKSKMNQFLSRSRISDLFSGVVR
jgi:hypothetical protein